MVQDMSHLSIVKKDIPPCIPVRPAVSDYLAATKRRRNAYSQKGYAQRLYCFADWADGMGISLETIDATVVDQFLDHLVTTHKPRKQGATQLSSATLSGFCTVIKSFLLWASRDRAIYGDFVEERTAREIVRYKIAFIIIISFSPEQIRDLLVACDDEENERLVARAKAIIHLLLGTGIRCQECCHLTLSDVRIEGENPSVLVRSGKGNKDRRVPLGPITLRKIQYYISTYRANQIGAAPLFTNRAGKEALTVAGVEQLMQRLGQKAGITGVRVSPHTLRHTFACNCVKRKMSVYALSKLLGHSSVVMTERYCRSLGADFDALAEMVQGQLR